MKVAILNLTSGSISGGYKKYLNNLLPRLVDNLEVESVLCAMPPGIQLQKNKDIYVVECKPYRPFSLFPDKNLTNAIEEYEPDIIFSPVERFYKFKNIPIVTMLQNMEPFTSKSLLNTKKINLKLTVQKLVGQKALKSSDGIICISHFVKDFLINELNIPRLKTSLIYHGISNPISKPQKLESLFLGHDHDFIFSAGSIRPARGLEDIIYAMDILKKNGFNNKLLIAGKIHDDALEYAKYLEKIIQEQRLSESVKFLGSINEKEMSWYYTNSELFVMTSKVESFGMIAGEALAHGCLNVSSLSPCLPEIFGDAENYYKPGDYFDLAEKIKTNLLLSDAEKSTLKEKSIKRAAKFSWNVCAKRTVKFFSETIERHNNENRP
jgi:glycosyltransferase involved in cell wall biosynthesis